MNLRRLKAITKKEFKHLWRDKGFLLILLFFPVMLLVMFGYAVNFDVQHIKLAVQDNEKSENSRAFLKTLQGSPYFDLVLFLNNDTEVQNALDTKRAQLVVVIPSDFSDQLVNDKKATLQFLVDGIDGNTAAVISNYMNAISVLYQQAINSEFVFFRTGNTIRIVDYQPVYWYNPDLNSTVYLLPGLISMILIVTAAISVSLTLVREYEYGTIEQIMVSPVLFTELLIGKILPYIVVALLNAIFILLAGYVVFGVSVQGSYLLLFLSTIIFLITATSLGIFISALSQTQQIAFTLATFMSFLPAFILSGFIFQIASMPLPVQFVAYLIPSTYFNNALRAIIIRGTGIETFWSNLFALILTSIILLTISNRIMTNRAKKA